MGIKGNLKDIFLGGKKITDDVVSVDLNYKPVVQVDQTLIDQILQSKMTCSKPPATGLTAPYALHATGVVIGTAMSPPLGIGFPAAANANASAIKELKDGIAGLEAEIERLRAQQQPDIRVVSDDRPDGYRKIDFDD